MAPKGLRALVLQRYSPPSAYTHRKTSSRGLCFYNTELRAILPALAYILRIPSTEYVFYSDSKSAIQFICNPFSTHPVVREVHRWLCMIRVKPSRSSVSLGMLALQGIRLPTGRLLLLLSKPPSFPVFPYLSRTISPPLFLSCAVGGWMIGMQQRRINCKLRTVKNPVSVWATFCCSARFQEVILSRLLIGHTRLTHRHLMC